MIVEGRTISYDSAEFKDLFDRLYPSMCMVADRFFKNSALSQDMAQEAFVKLWQKEDEEFESEQALRKYLYVLVKNASISELRKEKKIENSPIEEHKNLLTDKEFLDEVLKEETYRLLQDAISNLSPQTKKIIRLSLKGYINKEIAEELDVSINTVKTLKQRAYKTLRDQLGNEFLVILYIYMSSIL